MKLDGYTSGDDQVRGFTKDEIKQIQLDAMKEGMQRAAKMVDAIYNKTIATCISSKPSSPPPNK